LPAAAAAAAVVVVVVVVGGGISSSSSRGHNLLNVIESYIHCMIDEKISIKLTDEM